LTVTLKVGVYRINKGFFKRIAAQKGIALTTGRADYTDFQQHIEECSWISNTSVHKYIIDSGLRKNVQDFLNNEGITHDALYPNDITDGYIDNDKNTLINSLMICIPKKFSPNNCFNLIFSLSHFVLSLRS
jgi:hypothetical protein